jgi:hypothetical protein
MRRYLLLLLLPPPPPPPLQRISNCWAGIVIITATIHPPTPTGHHTVTYHTLLTASQLSKDTEMQ